MRILKEDWARVYPVLKSETRLQLLMYFRDGNKFKTIKKVQKESELANRELKYHLNLLLSTGLINNTIEKKDFGVYPNSHYKITSLGKKVLQALKL
ncbi:MAG: hypothetical protein ABIJ47_04910 [Candidatus Bathyarchaeota archaeon]